MKPLVLRPIQRPMIDFARANKRCAIWAGMGSGKTSAMEYLIVLLTLLGEVESEPWLVLGPMRVARDTWPEDMARWSQFADLRIVPLTGTPAQRLDRLQTKADIYTLSYELAPWLVSHYGAKWPFRYVIADESDRLKGFRTRQGGKRSNSLGRIAHNLTDRWINLTGTPSPNGLKDLWGQTWFLDKGERLGRTYSAFQDRWFRPTWSGWGVEPMPHSDKEIHAALEDICITVDPKDYFDLAEPIVTQIKVKLPEAARKIYKALEKELFAKLETGEQVEVFNAAALTNKCLQLANGAVYTTYPEWAGVHDEKIEALRSIMAESGGTPLLVAYSFKSDCARIKRAFPQAVELSTDDGMRAFRSGNAPIGLAHPKSMGHGIDGLQSVTNILVRFGHDWNLGERMQMLERIGPMRQLQGGFDRPVWVYDIVASDTIDEDVIGAHIMKRGVQDALLEAMKRRTQ
jgi:hypothetical protein